MTGFLGPVVKVAPRFSGLLGKIAANWKSILTTAGVTYSLTELGSGFRKALGMNDGPSDMMIGFAIISILIITLGLAIAGALLFRYLSQPRINPIRVIPVQGGAMV